MDPCAFDNEGLVKPQPFSLRFYPAFDIRQVTSSLKESIVQHGGIPERKAPLIERVKGSISRDGLRNPLIVEHYTQDERYPLRWMVTIGNNRYIALEELGMFHVPVLVLFPTDRAVPDLSGDYEELPFLLALARFDATYPWWNSAALCRFCPPLVPRCAQ